MLFLAVSTNTGDPRPYVGQEAARTQELAQQGVLDRMLVKADWSGAVLVLRAGDRAAATDLLDTLPLVRAGIASFDLTEVVDPAAATA